jgi:signal transduction histidine kinase
MAAKVNKSWGKYFPFAVHEPSQEGFFTTNTVKKICKNPHFWIILLILCIEIFIYQVWPWREWQFTGIWRSVEWISSGPNLAGFEYLHNMIGILFFIPIIYGAVIFSWKGALFSWLISLTAVLPIILNLWEADKVAANLIWLLIPFLLASIISIELHWRSREKQLYSSRELERRLYISQLLKTQESERQRIAQDIHDEAIQTMMVISNRAQYLVSSCQNKKQAEDITGLKIPLSTPSKISEGFV